mmetsp:Transcript_23486/g.33676  ORF Transcript_23486/g.33676 Transcript_23486/m.33676 type:complete len:92 (-) Transcript_23486:442-717(-)
MKTMTSPRLNSHIMNERADPLDSEGSVGNVVVGGVEMGEDVEVTEVLLGGAEVVLMEVGPGVTVEARIGADDAGSGVDAETSRGALPFTQP